MVQVNLAVRLSMLEIQVAKLITDVAEIRANYVTREYLDERLQKFKAELMAELNPRFDRMITKEDFLSRLAESEQRTRNWVLQLFFALFFSLGGLQFALLQRYLHK